MEIEIELNNAINIDGEIKTELHKFITQDINTWLNDLIKELYNLKRKGKAKEIKITLNFISKRKWEENINLMFYNESSKKNIGLDIFKIGEKGKEKK